MKKWIRFIAIGTTYVCLLAMITACASGEKTAQKTVAGKEDTTNSQEDAQKELSVIVNPAGWEAVEDSLLPVQYSKGTASFMAKVEGFRGETLNEVVEEAKKAFESAFDNVVYDGDVENITVDGKEAAKFIFTCEISSMKMKYEYVYMFAGNSVWAITFADLAESFDALAPDYEKILEEIKFN